MNKLFKFLVIVIIQSVATSAFALDFATAQELADCAELQAKAAAHSKWSAAMEEFKSNEKLSAKQINKIAQLALNKIYEDIYAVRDLVGFNEELTVLEQTPKLLRKVKTLEIEKANELMLDKLSQLDRAMFDSLLEAGQSISYCDAFAGRSRAVMQRNSDLNSESSAAVQ